MTTQTSPRNWTYLLVTGIVRLFMTAAAAISFSHIVATSHALGLGVEAYTVPLFIDGLAILGLVGRSTRFAATTQRAGLRLMAGAGLLSLACNVYAGNNLGQRLYGALVVTAFVVAEWYAARLRPAPAPALEPTRTGRRCEPGCACGKHRRIPKDPIAAVLAAGADAPVSPAPWLPPRVPTQWARPQRRDVRQLRVLSPTGA